MRRKPKENPAYLAASEVLKPMVIPVQGQAAGLFGPSGFGQGFASSQFGFGGPAFMGSPFNFGTSGFFMSMRRAVFALGRGRR
jgi:hypothetical protein